MLLRPPQAVAHIAARRESPRRRVSSFAATSKPIPKMYRRRTGLARMTSLREEATAKLRPSASP
jgi:hypothetical protein